MKVRDVLSERLISKGGYKMNDQNMPLSVRIDATKFFGNIIKDVNYNKLDNPEHIKFLKKNTPLIFEKVTLIWEKYKEFTKLLHTDYHGKMGDIDKYLLSLNDNEFRSIFKKYKTLFDLENKLSKVIKKHRTLIDDAIKTANENDKEIYIEYSSKLGSTLSINKKIANFEDLIGSVFTRIIKQRRNK